MGDRALGGLRAVTLDVLGTLVELQPPAPRLRAGLRERLGIELSAEQAESAMAAEIAYYLAHNGEGRDAPTLAALRRRCAGVLAEAIGGPASCVPPERLVAVLLDALHFAPFPDAAPALDELGGRGLVLVAVSNWDASLHDVLAATGLARRLDGIVASAEAGVAKPDPRIFARALELAGVDARTAVHVGDSPDTDVAGARAAGLSAVLLARDGAPSGAPPSGGEIAMIASLTELAPRLGLV